MCKGCDKRVDYQRVCRPSLSSRRFASASNSALSSVLVAAASHCLSKIVTQVEVNGILLRTLIDTGSRESYLPGARSETSLENHTVPKSYYDGFYIFNKCHTRALLRYSHTQRNHLYLTTYECGYYRPWKSPWRAQVLVTSNERQKTHGCRLQSHHKSIHLP